MNTGLRYVPATHADADCCWRVHLECMRRYVEATWGWDEAEQHRRFHDAFAARRPQLIIAGDARVGVLDVDYATTPVRLLNVQVAPQFQRRGLGTRVIRDVLERASTNAVWLQVLKANPARALYGRLGFEQVGETPTHWQMQRRPR